MPKIYTDANPSTVAYVIDGGGSGYQNLPEGYTSMQAEYLAVIYGLNEFYLKWNRELDTRHDNMSSESKGEFYKVATPSDETPRALPPPILICCDNYVIVMQLSRQHHIGDGKLRKLAQRVWQMTENIDVHYEWVSRKENLAGKMLR